MIFLKQLILGDVPRPEALKKMRVIHVRQDHEEVTSYRSRALGLALPDKAAQGRIDLSRMLTGPAYDLAAWAFSTEKLPALQLLAFGDFGSFDPRFRLLLRRDGDAAGGFRLVGEEDADIVGLLDEFLDSMVVGPTYSKPYLRSSGASLPGNVWRPSLGFTLARESGTRAPTVPSEECL